MIAAAAPQWLLSRIHNRRLTYWAPLNSQSFNPYYNMNSKASLFRYSQNECMIPISFSRFIVSLSFHSILCASRGAFVVVFFSAHQPAFDNLDPDAQPQAHPRAPPPELEPTDDGTAATATNAPAPNAAPAAPSSPPQHVPSSLEGDSRAGANSSSWRSNGSSNGGGSAFAIWALRRQVFRAFRAGEAGKARTILLRQPRQHRRVVLARQKRSGGANLELQSRIARQVWTEVRIHVYKVN